MARMLLQRASGRRATPFPSKPQTVIRIRARVRGRCSIAALTHAASSPLGPRVSRTSAASATSPIGDVLSKPRRAVQEHYHEACASSDNCGFGGPLGKRRVERWCAAGPRGSPDFHRPGLGRDVRIAGLDCTGTWQMSNCSSTDAAFKRTKSIPPRTATRSRPAPPFVHNILNVYVAAFLPCSSEPTMAGSF